MGSNRHLAGAVRLGAATALALVAGKSAALGQGAALSGEAVETVVVSAERLSGPGVALSGSSDYGASAADFANLPEGTDTALSDVLTQMPGVAIDENQQIHIRNTEGPQFQYQIDGVTVPLDINTNPPFLSMINPQFVRQLDLLTGVLPAEYSYATGGIVSIQTKDGCDIKGGSATLFFGQRGTLEPSAEYGGCAGKLSYYVNGLYEQSDTAFSSATPGPNAIHDRTNQGQAFGHFSYAIDADTKLNVILSNAASDNQLPNVAGLAPQFALAGVTPPPSADVNSYLNFRDLLGIVSLEGALSPHLNYQLSYTAHSITQDFRPDNVGELVYQGVASTASRRDHDNILQGDVDWKFGAHDLGAGFYLGSYDVDSRDSSLVFPVDPVTQVVGDVLITVADRTRADNVVSGIYLNDLWQIDDRLRLNIGLRWDDLTGFTHHSQLDPTANLSYLVTPDTTLHGGLARYMQVPSLLGISPSASAAFANTTGDVGSTGIPTPITEDDYEWDVGVVHRLTPEITLSEDNYYEITHHYLDTGQFGVVPIFAPFNYTHGYIWGSEFGVNYKDHDVSAYANLTIGRNMQRGVSTGQFNFDPDELAYIDSHAIVLDHQPLVGMSAGATYNWHKCSFSVDGIYSSGLRAGFADLEHLPTVLQFNVSAQRSFDIPGVGEVVNRVTVLNVFDRVNLIRPADGIGIFQSAYAPRLTVYDAITVPL